MKFVALFVLLAALSCVVAADRVGIVVQYDDSTFATDCVEFSGVITAYDALLSSSFGIETADFPPYGPGLCGIDSVGCPASNCFCDSNYWGFFYSKGGSWQYSNVGIGFPLDGDYQIVRDGGVIGFRWGTWGQRPTFKQFGDICIQSGPQAQKSEPKTLGLVLSLGGNCVGKVNFSVADEEGRVMPLAEVNVLAYSPGVKWEKIGLVVVDGDGKGSIALPHAGHYYFEAFNPMYIPTHTDIFAEDCAGGVAAENATDSTQSGLVLSSTPTPVQLPTPVPPKVIAVLERKNVADGLSNWALTDWNAAAWLFPWRPR